MVIVGFLLLAAAMFGLDEARMANEGVNAKGIWLGLFSDAEAARAFLGVIAGSIITVTTITLSLLLIAVQQGAAALTSLVFDQFLRRRSNQFYFGTFIGLALYSLIILASITPEHHPTYGVAVAGVMTVAGLYMLVVLIYTTINQMRPVVIVKSIHDHALLARERQRDLLRDTRSAPRIEDAVAMAIAAEGSGFAVRLDAAAINRSVAEADVEVVILVSIGDYVACGEPVAEIRTARAQDVASLEPIVRMAVVLEEQRDLDTDPGFGVDQLVTIGWTTMSTAKSNPGPGLLAIWSLRDLLARWLSSDDPLSGRGGRSSDSPVVYRDTLAEQLLGGFESLVVVASESMQHQCAAEIYRSFAKLFHRLPPALQSTVEELVLRSLSGLGDHILTSDLEASLSSLSAALLRGDRARGAQSIDAAKRQLAQSLGRLNSRSTRSQAGDDSRRSN